MLNTFQERWTPMIKSGIGGIARVSLFDLSKDPRQQKNLINELPEVATRLQESLEELHNGVLEEAPIWGEDDTPIQIHRLDSDSRSTFDAFAYVNRIPVIPEKDESQDDLAQRILSRLANQEGRILVKLPSEMNHYTYYGFKVAVESVNASTTGRCIGCHHMPEFGRQGDGDAFVPTLRNKTYSLSKLDKLLQNETHRKIELNQQQKIQLLAFIYSLKDISDRKFRNAIIETTLLDTSGDTEK